MDSKTVLVTGIGGNVGQGILRNINSLHWPVKIVGCNVTEFSSGNYLCDSTHLVPYAFDKEYVSEINKIIDNENIDLIIPSTDYEVYYLALNHKKINATIVASDATIAKLFLDKYLTYKCFYENNIPFAKSWLPKDFDFSCEEYIAKPREGRGSRGIILNPENPQQLNDEYIIQPFHKGIEITTAVYVTKKGKLHGLFSMERQLENGTTSQTIVNNNYNKVFEDIAKKIIDLGGVRASFNLQSIIDKNGAIFPFEVNGRISGTNSIRHNLGFQDVKYILQEYLYNQEPDPVATINGIATRIYLDVIYKGATNFEALNNKTSNPILY
ncbi:ATP-grasp domain-containing protein [Flavobacterium sp.]|uniref:ATP-grasp domain-containing protein n=1 Tax=Flavobacterium sp. TaxID=239 RepID=UPI0025EBC994|nr:ATP-grasp domain-containing protein [Flavobacterium sp.]